MRRVSAVCHIRIRITLKFATRRRYGFSSKRVQRGAVRSIPIDALVHKSGLSSREIHAWDPCSVFSDCALLTPRYEYVILHHARVILAVHTEVRLDVSAARAKGRHSREDEPFFYLVGRRKAGEVAERQETEEGG